MRHYTMAIEYHGMSKELENGLLIINLVFTGLFTVELAVKLIGLGLVEYFSDSFNVFDAVIVFFALIEVRRLKLDPDLKAPAFKGST